MKPKANNEVSLYRVVGVGRDPMARGRSAKITKWIRTSRLSIKTLSLCLAPANRQRSCCSQDVHQESAIVPQSLLRDPTSEPLTHKPETLCRVVGLERDQGPLSLYLLPRLPGGVSTPRPCTLHTTPFTLHTTPYTLHTPLTLHVTHYTLHRTPDTRHLTLDTPHASPYSLHR